MNSKAYKRQTDLVTPSQLTFGITILGVGGIGSWVAFYLAKMGAMSLTVVDFDKVEEHNIPSQLYAPEDIGTSKVDALQRIINIFSGRQITPIPFSGTAQEYAASGLPFGKVVIVAVDSLDERKKIWSIIKPLLGNIDLLVDCRMNAEQLRILCVSPYNADSIIKYQQRMDSNTKASIAPCTGRSIVYNTGIIGAMVASRIKRYAKGEAIEFEYNFAIDTLERV